MSDVTQLAEAFVAETGDRCGRIRRRLQEVLNTRTVPAEQIERVLRNLRALRGSCRIVGLTHYQNAVHAMEQAVRMIGNGDTRNDQVVRALLDSLDRVERSCEGMKQDGRLVDAPELQEVCRGLLSSGAAAPKPAATPAPQPAVARQEKRPPAPAPVESAVHRYNPASAGGILGDFVAEADEMLERLQTACMTLEQTPSKEVIDGVFRIAHTLKGSSGMIGLTAMNVLTHRIEEILDEARKGRREVTRDLIDLLLAGLDDLSAIVSKLKAGAEFDHDIGRMLADIEAFRQGGKIERPSPPVEQAPAPKAAALAEAVSPASKPPPVTPVEAAQSIRVDIGKLDKVLNLVGELVISKIRFDQRIQDIGHIRDEFTTLKRNVRAGMDHREFRSDLELLDTTLQESLDEQMRASEELQRISSQLQESVMLTRMVPVAQALNKFPRLVRDISKALDKQIMLTISGEETELDKTVVERISDPLVHLVRNAIDHGLETPDERRRVDKSPMGTISIRAFHQGDMVVLEVADDGSGIRRARVIAKAVEKGWIKQEDAATLSAEAVYDFIFKPGFSTADRVTDVSGRGVGMDAVLDSIRKLKGTVELSSVEGRGTKVTIKLPLTLAIIQVLMVKAGRRRLALPLASVQESLRVPTSDIHAIGQKAVFNLRGEAVSLIRLSDLLGDPMTQSWTDRDIRNIVVASGGSEKVGLEVDAFEGKREIVIKTLGSVLKRVKYAAGATILGDGSIVLIVDLPHVVRASKQYEAVTMAQEAIRVSAGRAAAPTSGRTVLLVDDSQTVLNILGPGLTHCGFVVHLAHDGKEALEILKAAQMDAVASDVVMPHVDGYELCRRIRGMPHLKNIPVVLFSTKSEKVDRARGFNAGADAYFVKPFEPGALADKIQSLLGRSSAVSS